MSQISKRVRDAVLAKLAHVTVGFNANLAAAVATASYGTEQPFTIDWSAGTSKNLFIGPLAPSQIDDTTPSAYPLVSLYTVRSGQTGAQKFNLFSGEVVMGLDFHLSWIDSKARPIFDDRADLVEDAVVKTFNDASFVPPSAVSYNGDVTLDRGPVSEGDGENWRQTLSFRLTFTVNTN
jgi:hypothetical protein